MAKLLVPAEAVADALIRIVRGVERAHAERAELKHRADLYYIQAPVNIREHPTHAVCDRVRAYTGTW